MINGAAGRGLPEKKPDRKLDRKLEKKTERKNAGAYCYHGIFKDSRGKKGSILVESAMVIPMIILIVMAVIYLMMDFYQLAIAEVLADHAVFQTGFDEGTAVRRVWAAENILSR